MVGKLTIISYKFQGKLKSSAWWSKATSAQNTFGCSETWAKLNTQAVFLQPGIGLVSLQLVFGGKVKDTDKEFLAKLKKVGAKTF